MAAQGCKLHLLHRVVAERADLRAPRDPLHGRVDVIPRTVVELVLVALLVSLSLVVEVVL